MGQPHPDFQRVGSPFQGRAVRLRAPEAADAQSLNELFDNADVLRYLAISWPEPVAGTRAWLDRVRLDPHGRTFVIETNVGETIGACSLEAMDAARAGWLGVWIGRPFWGHGFGTDAIRTLCRLGIRELNLQRISLFVCENNPRAKRAYQKVGFKEEGRLRRAHFVGGRHLDTIVMGLLVEDLLEE